ncbi:MAG: UDP-glucose/GDP-mannose dehydrogenase family protein [Chloroflexi bacterium]|nr:UDP-glucose/GDP-mannose dehydrogenase family protein [Chloroflexota bacterium]
MNICIVGSGHIGLVTGACLADMGNRVICMDDDERKIAVLKDGIIPFYEPELEEIVHRNVAAGRLSFTTSVEEGVGSSGMVFICVGTPQWPDGSADLSFVETASKRIAESMDDYKVIVDKSTVPVRTGGWVKRTVTLNCRQNHDFDIVSNPEFLREGKAVYDFMHPDRIVIGAESERAANVMKELYRPLNAPIIVTSIETAELIKHTSNAFLAMKVSYINALANICEAVGGDVTQVADGMGIDRRIGRDFLDAGIGYGGYCFPKDVAAFIKIAEDAGYDFGLLKAVEEINAFQRRQIIKKTKSQLWNLNGKTIGILGLSFKPNTDDIREAPSIDIINQLQQEGAKVKAYDPQAMEGVRLVTKNVELCPDPYQVADGSDALIIVTEWDEFKELDLPRIKELLNQPVIIDGRNIFEPAEMEKLGFMYKGVGR